MTTVFELLKMGEVVSDSNLTVQCFRILAIITERFSNVDSLLVEEGNILNIMELYRVHREVTVQGCIIIRFFELPLLARMCGHSLLRAI